jgi:dienelactone hydrolase
VLAPGAEDDPGVAAAVERHTAGQDDPGAPVLVVLGLRDQLVSPASVQAYVDRLCAQDATVELRTYPTADHGSVMSEARADVLAWMAARVAGEGAPSTCPQTSR